MKNQRFTFRLTGYRGFCSQRWIENAHGFSTRGNNVHLLVGVQLCTSERSVDRTVVYPTERGHGRYNIEDIFGERHSIWKAELRCKYMAVSSDKNKI